MMSRDWVKVSDIERCFTGGCYLSMNVPKDLGSDRVASFIHHHPAAASTSETPQLVVCTFNISSTGRCLSAP